MSIKCNLISLGKINKYILLIFSAGLFKLLLKLFQDYINLDLNSGKEPILWNNIPHIFFYSLGLSLSFSLTLIYKKCNKSKKEIEEPKHNHYLLVQKDKSVKEFSKLKKFLWILLISVIHLSFRMMLLLGQLLL